MTIDFSTRSACCLILTLTTGVLGVAVPARAQAVENGVRPCVAGSTKQLFTGTLRTVRDVPTKKSFAVLGLGAIAATSIHSQDDEVKEISRDNTLFKPGAFIGGTPFQLGAASATYAIGRWLGKPCAAAIGAELFQAQLSAQLLTTGLKLVTRRERPDGSGYSFPSGHTAVTFASATVLQRHFGWKAGIPAYGVATYVAASRVQMKRHYLSDVTFGAALGIVAGRTVSIGHGHRLMVTPITGSDGGVGAGFTLLGKP